MEQVGVDGVHPVPVAVEHGRQRFDLIEPEAPRQRPKPALGAGEAVRLLALRGLQPVLDVPEKNVGFRQIALHLGVDEPMCAELIEGG